LWLYGEGWEGVANREELFACTGYRSGSMVGAASSPLGCCRRFCWSRLRRSACRCNKQNIRLSRWLKFLRN
jgi:hypothetical protein